MRKSISLKFKAFLTFGALLFVAFVLAAGMKVAFATAPIPTAPDSELTPTHTGYEVGVELQVNGETVSADVGDVVFTGAEVGFDKTSLWNAVGEIADTLETAAIVLLANEIWAMPDGYCEFGDGVEISSTRANTDTTSQTEHLRFYANDDCELVFNGKEVIQESADTEVLRDTSSLFGISRAYASNPSRGSHSTNSECREASHDVTPENSSPNTETITNSQILGSDSEVNYFGIEVYTRLKAVDQPYAVDINGNSALDYNCTAALTRADAQFRYTANGDPNLKNYDGHCSRLRDVRLLVFSATFWEMDGANNCHREYIATQNSVSVGTRGGFKIKNDEGENTDCNSESIGDCKSPLLKILEENGFANIADNPNATKTYRIFDAKNVVLRSVASFSRTNSSYRCSTTKLPYIKISGSGSETGSRLSVPWTIRWASNLEEVIVPPRGEFTTELECSVRYYNSESSNTNTPVAPVAPTPDNRNRNSVAEYVERYHPGISFTKSVTVREEDRNTIDSYRVRRYTARTPENVTVYNYRFAHYRTENYTVTVPDYNYERQWQQVYNYAWRTFPVYENERYCVRRGGFLWTRCLEWGTRRVEVGTERRYVRVSPYFGWVNVRVAPFTREDERTRRVFSHYTYDRDNSTTALSSSELNRRNGRRISPYTIERPRPPTSRITAISPSQLRTSRNHSLPDDILRTNYRINTLNLRVSTDHNGSIDFSSCNYSSSTCRRHSSALNRAPIVARDNGQELRGSNWTRHLDRIVDNLNYDRDSVLGNSTKITTYEAARVAIREGIDISPLHSGRSISVSSLKNKVDDINDDDDFDTHAERIDELEDEL